MRAQGIFFVVWICAGLGAVLGSIAGSGLGRHGLFAGAIVGGPLGVAFGVWVASRVGWLAADARRSATGWGIVGFVIAIPIAVLNLHSAVTPVLACALTGAGALFGVGRATDSGRSG